MTRALEPRVIFNIHLTWHNPSISIIHATEIVLEPDTFVLCSLCNNCYIVCMKRLRHDNCLVNVLMRTSRHE